MRTAASEPERAGFHQVHAPKMPAVAAAVVVEQAQVVVKVAVVVVSVVHVRQ